MRVDTTWETEEEKTFTDFFIQKQINEILADPEPALHGYNSRHILSLLGRGSGTVRVYPENRLARCLGDGKPQNWYRLKTESEILEDCGRRDDSRRMRKPGTPRNGSARGRGWMGFLDDLSVTLDPKVPTFPPFALGDPENPEEVEKVRQSVDSPRKDGPFYYFTLNGSAVHGARSVREAAEIAYRIGCRNARLAVVEVAVNGGKKQRARLAVVTLGDTDDPKPVYTSVGNEWEPGSPWLLVERQAFVLWLMRIHAQATGTLPPPETLEE